MADRPLRIMLWVAGLAYLLSLLGAAMMRPVDPAPGSPGVATDPEAVLLDSRPRDIISVKPMLGFTLNVHHTTEIERYLDAVDQIAALGCDTLQVVTPFFQKDVADEQVRIEVGPGRGPSSVHLLAVLGRARERGLRTVLMPIVLLTDPRGNDWRGKISPQNWEPWWKSYRTVTDHFVQIAKEGGVDVYCIGSELLTTERQVERWQVLTRHVREQFSGQLVYSTNWDHYQVPALWRDLDMIGISGYWNLAKGADLDPPSDEDLARRWTQIRTQLMAYGQDQGKPILITELGYPSLPWALRDPWNYVNEKKLPSDPAAQARGYASFLKAWGDLLARERSSRFAGVMFYEWDVYHQGGPSDTGYGIRGKPALAILERWMREHGRLDDAADAIR